MIKEAVGSGSTIEEAKESAVLKLGASEMDDIQFEVLAMPKKKVLGIFGGSDAQVKASMNVADKKINKNSKNNKKNTAKPKAVKEKPTKKSENAVAVSESKPVTNEDKEIVNKSAFSDYGEAVDRSEIAADSPAGKAIAYIDEFLKAVDCADTEIKVASKEGASLITLNGENLSIVIGRRGETLDSLQYLASLAANNGGGHYKISLNIGDYRERREETLTALAKRISAQVLKNGKSRTLEPMNPYERRIIHTAVQEIDGVVSNSFGNGVGRRVVISPEGVQVKPPRINDRRRGGGGGHRVSAKKEPVVTEAREPKRDGDMPLYGKVK